MQHSLYLYTAVAVFGLLCLSTVVYGVCKKFKFPYPIGLLFAGTGLFFLAENNTALTPFFKHLDFSPDIVFYIFLPTLLFESAYHLNFRQLRGLIAPITALATIGVIISMLVIGFILHELAGIPWGYALLFGALISATDPVAVLAIFKEIRAPKRIATLVDGESLVNDATAFVAFQIMVKIVVVGTIVSAAPPIESVTGVTNGMADGLKQFFMVLGGGIIVGTVLGYVFGFLIKSFQQRFIQLTFSLVLAHATFLLAEGFLHVSGILATVTAGVILANFSKRSLDKETRKLFSEIWEFMGFLSNSLIFILLGLKLATIDFWEHAWLVGLAIFSTLFVARPIAVFVSVGVTNLFRTREHQVSFREQGVTIWGGLRGALSAAAILLLPASMPYYAEVLAMTGGVIIGSFLINGLTLSWFLRRCGYQKFSETEKLQALEADVIVNKKTRENLEKMYENGDISPEIYQAIHAKYKEKSNKSLELFRAFQEKFTNEQSEREIEKIWTYHALSLEKDVYMQLFEKKEVSEPRFLKLRESIVRQIDRLDRDELPDERKTPIKYAPEIPQKTPVFWFCKCYRERRFEVFRRRRIIERIQHYRARLLASKKIIGDFENLSNKHDIFRNSKSIKKIIKRYKFWNTNSGQKIKRLEREFPDVAFEAKLRIAERSCLELERRFEHDFWENGFITEKVFQDFLQKWNIRNKQCRNR